jgi:hypothetical protein
MVVFSDFVGDSRFRTYFVYVNWETSQSDPTVLPIAFLEWNNKFNFKEWAFATGLQATNSLLETDVQPTFNTINLSIPPLTTSLASDGFRYNPSLPQ